MKTPKKISSLELIDTCEGIGKSKWDMYMNGTTKASAYLIKEHIKIHLPELYASLALEYPNPWHNSARKKEGLFVYVHSAIEYFLKFEL